MSNSEPLYKFLPEETTTIRILDSQPHRMFFERSIGDVEPHLCIPCQEQKAEVRAFVNALEIIYKREPIPVRKKKSWKRYTSQKKWSRRFPIVMYKEYSATPKVLSMGDALLKKINAIKTTAKIQHATPK